MSVSAFARFYHSMSSATRNALSRRAFFRTAAAGAAVAAVPALLSSPALAEVQPLMRGALESLQSARSQLQNATADKGGHRIRALNFVDNAIAEVRAGIQFDNTH